MTRDDYVYTFIIACTSRSHARIRRICFHQTWLKAGAAAALIILCAALYGLYGLTQHVRYLRISRENDRLRSENERQRQQLDALKQRVDAVEDTSRRLVEMSGTASAPNSPSAPKTERRGAGGPTWPLSSEMIAAVEHQTNHLERELRVYEAILRQRAMIPSIWPVAGEMTDHFGTRSDPFGGLSSEFHSGLDIAAPWGTPVQAAGGGTVIYAGAQSGYGLVVVIDHGGLTTHYGHLSKIAVRVGQMVKRGEVVGQVGSTGRSTGPHLHYEVRINDEPVDPQRYLPSSFN
jgi:murein DD-endopeptidase MepM/ murein hydrolase activator NlpD